uniref:Uncharacterized protein n=1 Tax=Oryza punctata TaxID=4537 RepID=A0A0E0LQM0_ORYPU
MATAVELLPELARLGSSFRAPVAMEVPREKGIKFSSHLVVLGLSIMNMREEKNDAMVKTVKSRKPFKENYEQLLEDACDMK